MRKIISWLLAAALFLGNLYPGAAVSAATEQSQETKESDAPISLDTPHAVLMEASTGTILYEKGADNPVHPASVTKIMTVLLIFEALEAGRYTLEDTVTTSAHAKSMGGSQVFLEEGETQTVETLIKCIVIASGNDAAVAMAEFTEGSEEAFVQKMNERAKELGMKNTHFVDCCGLTDSADHYTSARDVALMSRELAVNFPQVFAYTSIWMEDITHVTARGSSPFTLSNTNKLLKSFEGCDGLKTGSTSQAKYCLSATAERGGIRLISVVLTAPDTKTRFGEAAKLMTYGFGICRLYRDEDRGKLAPVKVSRSTKEQVSCDYEREFTYLSTEGEDLSAVEKELRIPESIEAPIEKGDVVGELAYLLGGREIGTVNIVAGEEAGRAGYLDYLEKAGEDWKL